LTVNGDATGASAPLTDAAAPSFRPVPACGGAV
jgi:hypothetical protein